MCQTVPNVEEGKPKFMSVYRDQQFFGGHEEGGWHGNDTSLVYARKIKSGEDVTAIRKDLQERAERLQADCKIQGLETYWVTTEDVPGSKEVRGERAWA